MPLKNRGRDWRKFGPVLDQALTDQQIQTLSASVTWFRGIHCPNRVVQKENHNLNCTLCDNGFIYDAGQVIKATVTSVGLRQLWQSFGRYDAGSAVITTPPEVRLSWWDKIRMDDSRIRFSEILQRAPAGVLDKMKYKVSEVFRIVDSFGTDYLLNTHYTVNASGQIVWNNLGPPPGTFYTVGYTTTPTYVILDVMHQTRDLPSRVHGGKKVNVEFPVQAVGKLDFLVGDESRKDG